MQKIKEIFQKQLIQQTKQILCFNNQVQTVPFLFTNHYCTNNFRLEIEQQNQSKNTFLKLVSEKAEIQEEMQRLNNFLNILPNDVVLPQLTDFSLRNFSLSYNSTQLMFFKFFTQNPYSKEIFNVNFFNEEKQLQFTSQLVFSTVPIFQDQTLTFYELEKNIVEIKIDVGECLRQCSSHQLFLTSSHEQISLSLQQNFLVAKFQTPPAQSTLKFSVSLYEFESKDNLLQNIVITVIPMQSIELLPEPGIRKQFDLVIPSEINRQVKIHSSSKNVEFPQQVFNLSHSAYNKISGKVTVLTEEAEKIILRVCDKET